MLCKTNPPHEKKSEQKRSRAKGERSEERERARDWKEMHRRAMDRKSHTAKGAIESRGTGGREATISQRFT